MTVNKAYKFRLYPQKEQQVYFSKVFGTVRFLWNNMLENRIDLYKKFGSDKELLKANKPKSYTDFKREHDWMYEIDNQALANVSLNLQRAYQNFFRRVKNGEKPGFPKFKSKKSGHNSYTTNNIGNSVRIVDGKIKLPKIGWVKVVQHRQIPDGHKIKSCTISLSPSGKYHVSILTEYEREQPSPVLDKSKALGLDYSSPHFYVDSQGNEAGYPRFYRQGEERLAREHRKLSRMKPGSSNYKKQKIKVARIHEYISNRRKDWMHKKSKSLADEWDYVCVEDINLRGMAGALKLGKSTNDNGFGMFREFLAYKLADRGKVFSKIGKWFPSSKTCNECGYINKELTLSDREWACECGAHHSRDVNAAINIRDVGLQLATA